MKSPQLKLHQAFMFSVVAMSLMMWTSVAAVAQGNCGPNHETTAFYIEHFGATPPAGWTGANQGGPTEFGWIMNQPTSEGTPSSGTGPDPGNVAPNAPAPQLPPGQGPNTHFAYLESASGLEREADSVQTSVIQIPEHALAPIQLNFYFHMYGLTMALSELRVEYSVDNGDSWTEAFFVMGQQHEGGNLPWSYATLDLDNAEAGGTVIIRFIGIRHSGTGSDIAIDEISLTMCEVGTNDDCSNAIPVECGMTYLADTEGGTFTASAGTCVTTHTAPDVWFTFEGNGCTVIAETCTNRTFDTKLSVYTGSCNNFVCVTGNDDACGVGSRVTFPTIVGETYYIMVHGFSTAQGQTDLTITCVNCPVPPMFDPCDNDTIPPVITCPLDATLSLDPGLCGQVYNFNIGVEDNCPTGLEHVTGPYCDPCLDPSGGSALACAPFAENSIIQFIPLPSSGEIEYITYNQETFGDAPLATFNIYGVQPGNVVPYQQGGFPVLGSVQYQTDPLNNGQCVQVDFPSPVPVPSGGIWVEIYTPGATLNSRIVQTPATCNGAIGTGTLTYINAPACGFTPPLLFASVGFNLDAGLAVGFVVPPIVPVPTNTPGFNEYASGDFLPIGEHCFEYEATDNSGNTSSCSWCVVVEEYNNPTRVLACNDDVQISLDENCEVIVNADLILEGGPYGCYDDYIVTIQGKVSNVLGRGDIGRTFMVIVTDPETGSSCMGRVSVEDKLPPQLLCLDTVITCRIDPSPFNLGFPVPEGATVRNTGSDACPVFVFEGFDNCSNVELRYKDWTTQGDCGSGYDQIITRTWTATDEVGNKSTCVQSIIVELGTLSQVGAPCDFDDIDMPSLNCDNRRDDNLDFSGHIIPWFDGCVDDYLVDQEVLDSTGLRVPMDSIGWNYLETGQYAGHPSPYSIYWDAHPDFLSSCRCWGPDEIVKWYGTGLPVGTECFNIQYTYKDTRFELGDMNCDAGDVGCYKLLRQWTILDWCTGEIAGHNQIIKVTDDEGPEITYPSQVTVGMDVWSCEGTWDVPAPWIEDNCSNDTRYEVEVLTGDVFVKADGQWRVTGLEPGAHTAYITAFDCCGNSTTIEVTLNVVDDVPPVAVCESHTIVSIPGGQDPSQAYAKIFAESFDDGSHDNCNPVWFKVVRMIKGECNELNGDDDPVLAGYQEYPDDYVQFCCEDVGQTIMVRFLVFDIDPGAGPVNENLLRPGRPFFGHYTECMVEVEVQDKVQPTVVAPPTVVVSCDFWFDFNALSDPNDATFGRVVTNLADRGKVKTTDIVCPEWCEPNFKFNYFPPAGLEEKCALYDPVHPEFTYEHLWGFDGYALSSCGVTPTIIVNDQRECGQGRITRTISVPGGNGPVTATQTIFFVDCNPYFIEDENCFNFNDEDGVIWPCDAELRECNATTTPDVTGRPEILNDDNCSLVAVKYEDWVFDVVPNACFKIIRKWTVLDWCQYDPSINLTTGRWEYEQIILVNDATKPVLAGCADVTFCDEAAEFDDVLGTCVGYAELALDSVTDCTPYEDLTFEYKIDAYNDGTFDYISSEYTQVVDNNPFADDETNARDASGRYPIGTHRIMWIVEDMCGNIESCDYLFTVEDCKQPTPYCRTGLITVPMRSSGSVEVWAEDLNIGSFDNCPGDLEFHFDSSGTEIGRIFTCDDLEGEASKTFVVEMWVTDASGNKDYCTTQIEIQANGNCNTVTGGTISGLVTKSDDDRIANVDVRLFNVGNQMLSNMLTSNSGLYSFGGLPLSGSYTVEPGRNDNPLNGVSTKDMVAIQRHLLGLSELTDPYQLIAADVNNSKSISARDLLELRKLILGLYDSFEEIEADQRSWRFVKKDGGIVNAQSPWDFVEVEQYEPLGGNRPNTDFIGVKIGDVDGNASGSAQGGIQSRSNGELQLYADDVSYEVGDEVRVSISGENFESITGYQYTLHFDAAGLEFAGVESGALTVTESNFGLNRLSSGQLTTSWHHERGISAEGTLYTLVFRAKSSGRLAGTLDLSGSVTTAEAYTMSGETRGVSLEVRSKSTGVDYALYQNTPNPFAGETVISFSLPRAMEAQITIYDVTGKVLKLIEVEGVKGYNEQVVRSGELSGSGVLYYQLDTEDFTATKRMVVIK